MRPNQRQHATVIAWANHRIAAAIRCLRSLPENNHSIPQLAWDVSDLIAKWAAEAATLRMG
jgi:hypothetical protein